MNDIDFMRYSRQILLEDISIKGQQKLLDSQVLIVGLGGLGAPASLYLAGAGIGTIMLADNDDVHLSNLQRQIIFTTEDISQSKVYSAKRRLHELNPTIKLIVLKKRLMEDNLLEFVIKSDVVLDCTDNIETRQAINAACVKLNIPLITASAAGLSGQLARLTPPWSYGCYRCLWSENYELSAGNCRTTGILGPVVGMMGTMQALETIKLLTAIGSSYDRLYLFDAWKGSWCQLTLQRVTDCPVCGGSYVDSV